MNTPIATLKHSTVFGALNDPELNQLASLVEPWTAQPGEILATAGERATRFFILASGTLLITMDAGKALVINRPGDFIGLEMLAERGLFRHTLTALTQAEVLAITRDTFLEFIQEGSPAGQEIMTAWHLYLEQNVPFLIAAGDSFSDDHD